MCGADELDLELQSGLSNILQKEDIYITAQCKKMLDIYNEKLYNINIKFKEVIPMFKPITKRLYGTVDDFKRIMNNDYIKLYNGDYNFCVIEELESERYEYKFNREELVRNNVIQLVSDKYLPILTYKIVK